MGDRGWIVNMCSIASLVALVNDAPCASSKGAVSSMTCQAAVDYAPHRIHINKPSIPAVRLSFPLPFSAANDQLHKSPLITGLGLDPALLAELNRQHPFGCIVCVGGELILKT